MSHAKEVMILALVAAGCAAPVPPAPPAPATPPPRTTWRLAERDGLVVLEPEWRVHARFEARYIGPERPDVGQVVAVEICVPDASPGERFRFRVRPTRPGVRLVDDGDVETVGDRPVTVRFTGDSSGLGGVAVESESRITNRESR